MASDEDKEQAQETRLTAEVHVSQSDRGLPKWLIQVVAWVTGIGGLYLDYGLNIFGDEHLPWFVYAISVGIGYGLNPDLYAKVFGGRK